MAWRDQFMSGMADMGAGTVYDYNVSIRKFETWLESCGHNVQSAPPSALQGFVDYLATEENVKAATIHVRLSAVRQYIRWCQEHSIRTSDMRAPKLPARSQTTHPLDDGVLRLFLDTCWQMAEPYRTALMLIPLAGLRHNEVAYLRCRDVTLSPIVCLRVCSHRGERIVVPLRPTWPILANYIVKVRPKLGDTEWLFPRENGRRNITVRLVKDRLKATRRYCNEPSITTNGLRHTFIELLQQGGVPDTCIRKLLGNRDSFLGRKHTKAQLAFTPGAAELAEHVRQVVVPWAPPKKHRHQGRTATP
jgi:site-specific recombinase XerD